MTAWSPAADTPLGPWLRAGVLGTVDVHAVAALGRRSVDPVDVALALALAVRAPRHGHVCVDLLHLSLADLLPEQPLGPDALALPHDRAAWVRRVAESALVSVRDGERGAAPAPPRAFVLQDGRLYASRWHCYETTLLAHFRARFADERAVADEPLLLRGLDALFGADLRDPQRQAGAAAVRRGAVVVTGGPGTGKTWTVRNVLTLLFAQWAADPAADPGAPPRIALAAPTGKAAARVVASIRSGLEAHVRRAASALPEGTAPRALAAFLTSLPPFTLHRLLGWNPQNPTRFRHDAARPLPYDVVLVDETSMVDVALMAKLVEAVPPRARLMLLGDRHQLASVEAGTVLADLCAGGPSDSIVFLTKSRRYRSDSGIGRLAEATLDGNELMTLSTVPPWPDNGAFPPGRDVGRYAPTGSGEAPALARELVLSGLRPTYERLRAGPRSEETLASFHAEVLRSFERFRVLAAHRRGVLGVEGLNPAIEGWLQDAGLIDGVRDPAYLGRPILILRNDVGTGRFNGDVGMAVRDGNGRALVAFPGADGAMEYLAPVRLPDHETVFAMTIHKSQGSEFDEVLVVLPAGPSPVLTRELLYTGATRAKKRLTLLATGAVLAAAVRRPIQRASGLGARLAARADDAVES